MRAPLLAVILGILGLSSAAAAPRLEVIELHSRSAKEMIPMIAPLLDPGTSLSGTGYQLIAKAEPEQLVELRRLVHQLDTPLRNLVISVRQVTRGEAQAREIGASGRVGSGEPASIDLELRAQADALSRDGSYRVRTLEGREAFVRAGRRVPYRSSLGRYGSTVDYQTVSSGFFVTPHLRGGNVQLEISPRQERLRPGPPGPIDTRQASTVVTGALGEWITLADVDEREESRERGIASRSSAAADEEYVTQVRVELVP
ncbi:MAG: hypothetical protein PVF91_14180 [Chromatiales bacterium]|jgi:type II secretory pathway component GspD/PulD (secretin)